MQFLNERHNGKTFWDFPILTSDSLFHRRSKCHLHDLALLGLKMNSNNIFLLLLAFAGKNVVPTSEDIGLLG